MSAVDGWWRVELPWATFGVKVAGNRIVDAAQIARWSVGKSAAVVLSYFVRKGGTVGWLL